jgi:outer membrane protein assembly factor BamD (BamD/ComL family)
MKNLFLITLLLSLSLISFSQEGKWEKTQKKNTIESYQVFLEKYPSSEFTESAKQKLIELEFKKAEETNTIDGYKYFLSTYNENAYTNQARKSLNKLEYDLALSKNSIDGYKYFIESYKSTEYNDEAITHLIELEHKKCLETNTVGGYKYFLDRYNDNQYYEEIKDKLITLEYNKAVDINTVKAYQYFLDNYNHEKYSTVISDKIYSIAFSEVKNKNNIKALNEFLIQYPQSNFSDSAWFLKENILYTEIGNSSNIQDFKTFLELYPKSTFKNNLLGKLEIALYKSLKDTLNYEELELLVKYFPKSQKTNEIKNLFDKSLFEETKPFCEATKTYTFKRVFERLEYYLKIYPDGKYTNEAKIKLKEYQAEYDMLSKSNKHILVSVESNDNRRPTDNFTAYMNAMLMFTFATNNFTVLWSKLSYLNNQKSGFLVSGIDYENIKTLKNDIPEKYIWIHLILDKNSYNSTAIIITPGCKTSWTNITFEPQDGLSDMSSLPDFVIMDREQGIGNISSFSNKKYESFIKQTKFSEPLDSKVLMERKVVSDYLSSNNLVKAKEAVEKISTDGDKMASYLNIAEYCYENNMHDEMIVFYKKALDLADSFTIIEKVVTYPLIGLSQNKCRLKKDASTTLELAKSAHKNNQYANDKKKQNYYSFIEYLENQIYNY